MGNRGVTLDSSLSLLPFSPSVSPVTDTSKMCPFLPTYAAVPCTRMRVFPSRSAPAPVLLSVPASQGRVSLAQVRWCRLFSSHLSRGRLSPSESMPALPFCGLPAGPRTTSPAPTPPQPPWPPWLPCRCLNMGLRPVLCDMGLAVWHSFPSQQTGPTLSFDSRFSSTAHSPETLLDL